MHFKTAVYKACVETLDERWAQLKQVMSDLHYSAANETKSTAGDKHETALAMLQIEQENNRRQIAALEEQRALLSKIDPLLVPVTVTRGSLVLTNQGYFFIGAAVGKITVNDIIIFCISSSSPLGAKMAGKIPGASFELNGRTYTLLNIS